MNILGLFQRLGRALQLPIAVLPVAALLLRFGQPDLLNVPFIAQTGGAIFDSLALIFAIGVASNWSKDNVGAAALAGTVSYFILTKAMVTINPTVNMGVLAGVIIDLAGGAMYDRWPGIKLPNFLSFFDSERFMSIAASSFYLMLAAIFGYVWLPVRNAIHTDGEWIVGAGALNSGIFGFIDRLLIPTGLHQVLNTIAQFQIDEFTSVADTVLHGDINRFYVGNGTAGMFVSGFSPIMTFGLPDAALVIHFTAPKARRPMVSGMLLSIAVTTFLAGVVEPLEFLFMLLAPLLYLLHALLTGINLFVATLLGIHTGFSFSAGAVGYVLIYNLPATSQNIWVLVVMGLVLFVIYFVLFSAVIRMFNLEAPDRKDKEDDIATEETNSNTEEGLAQLAANYIAAAGSADNLKAIDACITRLRLTVADSGRVNNAMCKRLDASGMVKLNKQAIQVIAETKAESIGDEMKKVVACSPVTAASGESAPAAAAPIAEPQAVASAVTIEALVSPITGDVVTLDQVPDEAFASKTVGDGVVVKPADRIVVAPATDTITKIFNTNHTFCLEIVKGAETVVHMGIDTVALESKDFRRLVEEGTEVTVSQPTLEVDLEFLNVNARPMISPVVCGNSDDFGTLVIKAEGHVVTGQTPLYEIKGK